VAINKLPTGVPGLDDCGRRSPEFSFNIIAAPPEAGRRRWHTSLCCQCNPERPALYFSPGRILYKHAALPATVHIRRFGKLPNSIRFIHLSQVVFEKDLGAY